MNPAYRNIDRSPFNQTAIVGINNRLSNLMFNIGFLSTIGGYLQGIQQRRITGPTGEAFYPSHFHIERTKDCLDLPVAVPPPVNFTTTAKPLLGIILTYMAPQSLPHLTGIKLCPGQPIYYQIIIRLDNLFQYPKHQRIPKLLQSIYNLVQIHFPYCQIKITCYTDASFHHGLSFKVFVSQNIP